MGGERGDEGDRIEEKEEKMRSITRERIVNETMRNSQQSLVLMGREFSHDPDQ